MNTKPTAKWHAGRFIEHPDRLRFDCLSCNLPMWFPPSKHGKYLTCGPACSDKLRRRQQEERRRECATCGNAFYPRLAQINSGRGTFCSQKCNTAGRVAMMSPEAQKKARATWVARHQVTPFVVRGPAHPRWKGGRNARYDRAKAAGKLREYWTRRRELIQRGGVLSAEFVRSLPGMQRWKCAACKARIRNGYEIDHIVPLSRGGTNANHNLQALCKPCNRRKHARDPIEFMQSLGRLL